VEKLRYVNLKGKYPTLTEKKCYVHIVKANVKVKKVARLTNVLTKATILAHNYHITRLEGEQIWIF
jgi:hypothetical protein